MNIKTLALSLALPVSLLFPAAATHAVVDLPEDATGVTEDTYAEIREDWADKDSAFYQNLIGLCDEELSYGQWTKDGFQGKMILRVDDGNLYYVSTDSHIMELEKHLGEHSLYYGLRQEAEKVGRTVKNHIPKYPVTFPDRY
ncbi:MAG: hypothetical protein AAB558_02580 [Patescibacteria group bacterium]